MNNCTISCIAILILSIVLAGFLIPKILLIAFRKNLFDVPDERKIHKIAVPRLGGLAFVPVIFFSITFVIGMNLIFGVPFDHMDSLNEHITEIIFEFCGLLLLYIVGLADDLIGVRYVAKFYTQSMCAIMLVLGGTWIHSLNGLIGIGEIWNVTGYLLTILVVVFFTNAINLIDGVDGLASGLSISALLFYMAAFIYIESYIYVIVSIATLGVLIPFFYYNVFGDPKAKRKIFMGDTGSLTLGFTLSFLSISLENNLSQNGNAATEYNAFIVAFSPMIIPCFDVLRVFFRRIRHRKSPFIPDKTHIHHKLILLGMSTRKTMVLIVITSILLTLINVLLSSFININILVVGNLILWIVVNKWITNGIRKRNAHSDFDK